MRAPRYKLGDLVFHKGKRKPAFIVDIINSSDPKDVRAQGFRYLISHSGQLWSVPEDVLALLPEPVPE